MAESISTTPTFSGTQAEAQPMSTNFIHASTAANLSAWIQSPLVDVGSNTMPLGAYPSGTDIASRNASKKQILNTFSSLCLSHSASLSLQPIRTSRARTQNRVTQTNTEFDVTMPAPSALLKLTSAQKNSYLAGELVYTQVSGFVTRTSLVKKMERLKLERCPTLSIDNVVSIAHNAMQQMSTAGPSTSQATAARPSPSLSTESQTFSASVQMSGDGEESDHSQSLVLEDWEIEIHSLPIRYVNVSHLSTLEESPTTPYTPICSIISSFANDQGTAIRATLKNAAARDATTWSLIANSLQHEHGSYMDIAPMLRTALLAHSLSNETAIYDAAPLKVIRNIDTTFESLQYQSRPVDSESFKIIAMPLDTFSAFLALNTYYNTPPDPFTPTEVDRSWIALPVTAESATAPYIHEYIAMHFASDLTYGTVSYKYTVSHADNIGGSTMTVPASNLAYVSGPKNIILVLIDSVNSTSPPTMKVGTMNIPTFVGRTNPYPPNVPLPPPTPPFDFGIFWQGYYNVQRIHTIRANLFQSWDYMCQHSAVENTCGRALSMAAEMVIATPPGLFVHPKTTRMEYDLDRLLSGGIMLTVGPDTPYLPISPNSQ